MHLDPLYVVGVLLAVLVVSLNVAVAIIDAIAKHVEARRCKLMDRVREGDEYKW